MKFKDQYYDLNLHEKTVEGHSTTIYTFYFEQSIAPSSNRSRETHLEWFGFGKMGQELELFNLSLTVDIAVRYLWVCAMEGAYHVEANQHHLPRPAVSPG